MLSQEEIFCFKKYTM